MYLSLWCETYFQNWFVIEDFQLLPHCQVSTCLCPLVKATKKFHRIQQPHQQHFFNLNIWWPTTWFKTLDWTSKPICHDLFSYQMDAKKKWKVKLPKFVASCGQTLLIHDKKYSFLARLSRTIWNSNSSQMFQQVGMINYNTSTSNQCP